jgi:SAM-dependent methyltransferase
MCKGDLLAMSVGSTLATKARIAQEIGAIDLGRGALGVVRNRRLQRRFGFDQWHIRASYELKPYKGRVVATVSAYRPTTVVEVGCGLGDIIARIPCARGVGVDRESAVVEAARELYPDRTFIAGEFGDLDGVLPPDITHVDALILVNWPHLLPIAEIADAIGALQRTRHVSRVFIDGIRLGTPGYKYWHTREDVAALGRLVETVPGIHPLQDLFVIELGR